MPLSMTIGVAIDAMIAYERLQVFSVAYKEIAYILYLSYM
jgi:hypothetical protein